MSLFIAWVLQQASWVGALLAALLIFAILPRRRQKLWVAVVLSAIGLTAATTLDSRLPETVSCSLEDWRLHCQEITGAQRAGDRRPAVFGSTSERVHTARVEVDAATALTGRWRSLGRPAVRRPDHPAGVASLPRSAAPAGPDRSARR